MKYRPYVSLDIETTGISDDSHIIEIGAVFETWDKPVSELNKIRIPIKWECYKHAEPYALMLNANLIKSICTDKEFQTFSPGAAASELVSFLNECSKVVSEWDIANGTEKWGKGKIQFAGKNFAGFDGPKLELFLESIAPSTPATASSKQQNGHFISQYKATTMHRVIDVGPMYFDDFGYVPNLTEINKLNGRTEVTHCAVDDAIDVIVAIRKKAGLNE